MLVSFFRNPILLKVVGSAVALAFLSALVGYRNMLRFVLPGLFIFICLLLIRNFLRRRKRRLTPLEEEYLKKRFYEH
jgi:energy-coupling factor transporter transmembrane protein EcfT